MMAPSLPLADRFEELSDDAIGALRQHLPDASELAAAIAALRPSMRIYDVLQAPVIVEKLEAQGTGVIGLFCFGLPLEAVACEALLGVGLTNALLSAGLLVALENGSVTCPFRLSPYQDTLIFSDFLSAGGSAVFGSGPGSRAFATLRDICNPYVRALDIGCGAGAVMLHLARHTEHVLGTDINPRAGPFVHLNARLNKIRNVSFQCGHLFDPVQDQLFDLIVSQPPFMPLPAGKAPAVFRDAGADGSELWATLLADISAYLTTDGIGILVCETAGNALAQFMQSLQSRKWLAMVGATTPADSYAIRAAIAQLHVGFDRYSSDVRDMLRHLIARNIDGLSPAVVLVQRTEGDGRGHILEVDRDVWQGFSALRARTLLQQLPQISEGGEMTFRLSPDLLKAKAIRITDQGGEFATCQLALPRGALLSNMTLEFDLMQRLWRGPDRIRLVRQPHGWSFLDEYDDAGTLSQMVDAGLLQPDANDRN